MINRLHSIHSNLTLRSRNTNTKHHTYKTIKQSRNFYLNNKRKDEKREFKILRCKVIYASNYTAWAVFCLISLKYALYFVKLFKLAEIANFQNLLKYLRFLTKDSPMGLHVTILGALGTFYALYWICIFFQKLGFQGKLDELRGLCPAEFNIEDEYSLRQESVFYDFNQKSLISKRRGFQSLKALNRATLSTLDFGYSKDGCSNVSEFRETKFFNFSVNATNLIQDAVEYILLPFLVASIDTNSTLDPQKPLKTAQNLAPKNLSFSRNFVKYCSLWLCLAFTTARKFNFWTPVANFQNKFSIMVKRVYIIDHVFEVLFWVFVSGYNHPGTDNDIPRIASIVLSIVLTLVSFLAPVYVFGEVQMLRCFWRLLITVCVVLRGHIFGENFLACIQKIEAHLALEAAKTTQSTPIPSSTTSHTPYTHPFPNRNEIFIKIAIYAILAFLVTKHYISAYYDFKDLTTINPRTNKFELPRLKFLSKMNSLVLYLLSTQGTNFGFPRFLNLRRSQKQGQKALVMEGMVHYHTLHCTYLNCTCRTIIIDEELLSKKSDKNLQILDKKFENQLNVVREFYHQYVQQTKFQHHVVTAYAMFLTNFQNKHLFARKLVENKLTTSEHDFKKFYFCFFQYKQLLNKINKGVAAFTQTPAVNLKTYDRLNLGDFKMMPIKRVLRYIRMIDVFKYNMNRYLHYRNTIFNELSEQELNMKLILKTSIFAFKIEQYIEKLFDLLEEDTRDLLPGYLVCKSFYFVRIKNCHHMAKELIHTLKTSMKRYFKSRKSDLRDESLFKNYLETRVCLVANRVNSSTSAFSSIHYVSKNAKMVIGHDPKKLINRNLERLLPDIIKPLHSHFLRTSSAFRHKSMHNTTQMSFVNNEVGELVKVQLQVLFFMNFTAGNDLQVFSFVLKKKQSESSLHQKLILMLDKGGYIRGASRSAIDFFGLDLETLKKGKLGINYLANEFDLLIAVHNWRILLGLSGESFETNSGLFSTKNDINSLQKLPNGEIDQKGKKPEKTYKKESRDPKNSTQGTGNNSRSNLDRLKELAHILPLFFEKEDIALMKKLKGLMDSVIDKLDRIMYMEYKDPNRKMLKGGSLIETMSPNKLELVRNSVKNVKRRDTRRMRAPKRKTGLGSGLLRGNYNEKDLEIVQGLFKMKISEVILPTFTIMRTVEFQKISSNLSNYREILERKKKGSLTMAEQMMFGLTGDEKMIDPDRNLVISIDKSICLRKSKNRKIPKELKLVDDSLIKGDLRFRLCNYASDFEFEKPRDQILAYLDQLYKNSLAFQTILFQNLGERVLAFERASSIRRLTKNQLSLKRSFSNAHSFSTRSRSMKTMIKESKSHFSGGGAAHKRMLNKRRRMMTQNELENQEDMLNQRSESRLITLSKMLSGLYRGKLRSGGIFRLFFWVVIFSLVSTALIGFGSSLYVNGLIGLVRAFQGLDLVVVKVRLDLVDLASLSCSLSSELEIMLLDGGFEQRGQLGRSLGFLLAQENRFLGLVENAEIEYLELEKRYFLGVEYLVGAHKINDMLEGDPNTLYDQIFWPKKSGQNGKFQDGFGPFEARINLFGAFLDMRTLVLSQRAILTQIQTLLKTSKNSQKMTPEELRQLSELTSRQKYSTQTFLTLLRTTYTPLLSKISHRISALMSKIQAATSSFSFHTSLAKSIVFLTPYFLASYVFLKFQLNISKTFKLVKEMDLKDISRLIVNNQQCKLYLYELSRGYRMEHEEKTPSEQLSSTEAIQLKMERRDGGGSGVESEESKSSGIGRPRLGSGAKKARFSMFAKNPKNGLSKGSGGNGGQSMSKKRQSKFFNTAFLMENVEKFNNLATRQRRLSKSPKGGETPRNGAGFASHLRQRRNSRLDISPAIFQRKKKNSNHAEDFVKEIFRGIFAGQGRDKKSLREKLRSEIRNPRVFAKGEKIRPKKRILVRKVKKGASEDFGRSTYLRYMLVITLAVLLIGLATYWVGDYNFQRMRAQVEALALMDQVAVVNAELGQLPVYYAFWGLLGDFSRISKIEKFRQIFGNMEDLVALLNTDSSDLKFMVKGIESSTGFLGLLHHIGVFTETRFSYENSVFVGAGQLCDRFFRPGAGQGLRFDLKNGFKFRNDREVENRLNEAEGSFLEQRDHFSSILGGTDAYVSLCASQFDGTFQKGWNFFEAKIKIEANLALTMVSEAINELGGASGAAESAKKRLLDIHREEKFREKSEFFSAVLVPVLELELEILSAKELQDKLAYLFMMNSLYVASFASLLFLQILLNKFVKKRLEEKFRAHQVFLSLFDVSMIARKKVLKNYIKFYDFSLANQIYDVIFV